MSRLGEVQPTLTFLPPLWGFVLIGLAGTYAVLRAILLLDYLGVPASSYMHLG
jgi:hypothetical protein